MTIGQALSNALSGLNVAGRRASVTANNIANAQTDGFTARSLQVSQRVTGGVGSGVISSGVINASAPAITAERRAVEGNFARQDALANALSRIASRFGGPDDPSSLTARFSEFSGNLRALADTPDDAILQVATVNSARDIVGTLNSLSSFVQTVRSDADADIAARVNDVNAALEEIVQLNSAIASGESGGSDVSALIDQRNGLIDTVNSNIPVRVIPRNGGVDLVTPEGVFLLAGTAQSLSFTPVPAIAPRVTFDGGAGALSGLSVNGVDITPGGPSGRAPQNGALAGLFSVRDTAAPEISLALDAVALDLADRFSAPGLDPTVSSGAPGLFTDAGVRAEASEIVGLAGRLSLNAALDPARGGAPSALRDGLGAGASGPAGADGFLRALVDAFENPQQAASGLQTARSLTALEASAQVTSLAANALNAAEGARDGAELFLSGLTEAEIGETGVDTDAELQRLLTIEQAYAANARVIQTVDRLIQRLLEI